jgi:hypothetical protein
MKQVILLFEGKREDLREILCKCAKKCPVLFRHRAFLFCKKDNKNHPKCYDSGIN